MKKILITGATGFIGRHCLPLLKKKGYEIYALSSKKTESPTDGINWIQFDLIGNQSIKELVAAIRPSHLLHFAWVTTPGKIWTSTDNLKWLRSSIELVEAFALEGGKRAVLAGTCAEYDWTAAEFSESKTICRPHTLYGSCKLALHLILENLSKEMGLSQAWARIFYLYGPHEYSQRFIPAMIKGLLLKEKIPCSHCNQIKDFLHVEDVADAFVTLLESQLEGAINIGSGIGISLKQMVQKITDQLGGQELVQFGALSFPMTDADSLIADTTRLKKELAWTPAYSLQEGLNRTIQWWKDQVDCSK
jgi:nucleoside-diphosphate-sugar epimerase